MELGPILKTLLRNKVRYALIGAEVALTLAVGVNCINMMQDLQWQMDRPTGLDEAGIIVVTSQPFDPDFREEGYLDECRRSDLELLRALQGVLAADAFSAVPMSGSGSSSGYKPLGSEINTIPANVFETGPQGIDSLGVRLVAGRNFTEADINESRSKNVIVTRAFADRLFPDGDALGKQLQGREPNDPDTIVGIIEHMHGSWPTWRWVTHVMLRPGRPGGFNWGVRYLVRAEHAQVPELLPVIEKQLLAANNGRNVTVERLTEVKARTFSSNVAVIRMLRAVIVLLVGVTALGIVGITSFSVTERVHHIGTRRALGARQVDILRYFLAENWLMTTTGIAAGTAISLGLNYLLVTYVNGVKLDWPLLVYGAAGMWLVGLGAALVPAWRGARIPPAVATRNL
ncbi:MAG: ABC transporter permease [Acidobacteriota bacterium]